MVLAEAAASIPMAFWLMFVIPLIASVIGFYRFVYFISVGYAAAILLMVAQGVQLLIYGALPERFRRDRVLDWTLGGRAVSL